MGVTTEPPWLNKTVGVSARNGTSARTIDPSTFGDDPFTPTAGSLLLVIVYAGVTHAAAGWTERLSPVNSGELSVFEKTAAGSDTIALTHNASNYPAGICFLELPAGSTWTTGVGGNLSGADTPSAVTGLPGTEQLVISALGRVGSSGGLTNATAVWNSPWVEDADLFTAFATTDGMFLTVGHQINVTATSATASITPTYTGVNTPNDRQGITFAINAVAPGGGTTPFTKDYVITWRVLNNFTKDYAIAWRVLNTFTKDYAIAWRVLNTFTKDYSITWRVLNTFTKDYAIEWRVLNTFTKDYAITWDIDSGTSFTKDYAITWRVLNNFTKDYAIEWRVLNSFTKDYSITWRVLNTFTKDYAIAWRVLSSFTKDYPITWRVLNIFTKDYIIRWDVLELVGGVTATYWYGDVEIPLELEGVWSGGIIVPVSAIEVT